MVEHLKSNKRLLGTGFDQKTILEPKPSHSLLIAAAGSGKTTSGAIPWLLSMIGNRDTAIVVNDCKDGEIAAQTAALCHAYGRRVAIIDDFGVLGESNLFRAVLNPLGNIISAHDNRSREMVFATENSNHALIPEPPDDAKNMYFRDSPRTLIEFCELALLRRNPSLCTPGGVWALLANPDTLISAAKIEAEEGDDTLSALAATVVDMHKHNKEHFGQHLAAAIKALRIYSAGSPLHRAGTEASITHLELLQRKYVIFIVGPQRHMERLGAHYALHLQSFNEGLLSGKAGPTTFILDEFTNAPLKSLVSGLTTMRGYGGTCHMIAQSRSEIQRKYGEKETATIEENALVKQWFGFSSFEEAERVSRAMGEGRVLSHSMGFNSSQLDYSSNLSTAKDRLFTAEQLMRLPRGEQIIHVKDVGFIHCKKLAQHQIAPFCHGELAANPLEGPQRPADPKVMLPIKKERRQ